MGYVNTPAHMSASLAAHGGDTVWPGNQSLVIRRANVYATRPAGLPTGIPGTNLGWVESIGPAIQALTAAGAATYGVIEARKASKKADANADKANKIAAEAAQAARLQAEATQVQIKQAEAQQATQSSMPLIIGAGIAGVGLLMFIMKMKR